MMRSEAKELVNDFDSLSWIVVTIEFMNILGCAPGDVYIKLAEGRYLKYLNRGDIFTEMEMKKLHCKKVTKLFFEFNEESSLNVVGMIRSGIFRVVNKANLTIDSKISIIHSQVISMVKSSDSFHDIADLIKVSVESCIKLISERNEKSEWEKVKAQDYPYSSRLFIIQASLCLTALREATYFEIDLFFRLCLCSFIQEGILVDIKLLKIKSDKDFHILKYLLRSEEVARYLNQNEKMMECLLLIKGVPSNAHAAEDGDFERANSLFKLTGFLAREIISCCSSDAIQNVWNNVKHEGFSSESDVFFFDVLRRKLEANELNAWSFKR